MHSTSQLHRYYDYYHHQFHRVRRRSHRRRTCPSLRNRRSSRVRSFALFARVLATPRLRRSIRRPRRRRRQRRTHRRVRLGATIDLKEERSRVGKRTLSRQSRRKYPRPRRRRRPRKMKKTVGSLITPRLRRLWGVVVRRTTSVSLFS